MAILKSFRDLEVYQMALVESKRIFTLTQSFPKEETFSLTDQIRRSSRAVNALIAESWSRRKYKAAFANTLSQALGEAMETQAWLEHAMACGYINTDLFHELDSAWQKIGGKLNRMIQRADKFVVRQ